MNHIRKLLISVLSIMVVFSFAINNTYAETIDLTHPSNVELVNGDGNELQEDEMIAFGEVFYLIYNFDPIDTDQIDFTKDYELPDLDNTLTVSATSQEDVFKTTVYSDGSNTVEIGVLTFHKATKKTIFKFDSGIKNQGMLTGFHIKLGMILDAENVKSGETITIKVPPNGDTQYEITAIDKEKTKPIITKTGPKKPGDAGYDEDSENITWTIKVVQGANPDSNQDLKDTYSINQEYVPNSFKVDGNTILDTDLKFNNNTITYQLKNVTPLKTYEITYQTHILPSAYKNSNGVPLSSGNISCVNNAQLFYPSSANELTSAVKATFTKPITWLYKSSTNIINHETGEMEWTITIYNNGLSMKNITLYDRLSPGIIVKENSATIQIGTQTEVPLSNFKRGYLEDQTYDKKQYNLDYLLSDFIINDVTTIKYRTIIEDKDAYNASEYMPPNSIYDNRAFINYETENGDGTGIIKVTTPEVKKDASNDTSLLGKVGKADLSKGKIKWTITVNSNGNQLTDLIINDALARKSSTDKLESHEYKADDLASITYKYNGTTYQLSSSSTDKYYYEVVNDPSGKIYDIKFHLGDSSKQGVLAFTSSISDIDNVVTNSKLTNYRNQSMVTAYNNGVETYSYATADVAYKPILVTKINFRTYEGAKTPYYIYDGNKLGWQISVNSSALELKDIFIKDTLVEGTTLVDDSIRILEGASDSFGTFVETIPKYTSSTNESENYYKYDETTREIIIHLKDIPSNKVGTTSAGCRIGFYVNVDVDNPKIYNATTKKYNVSNTATLTANYNDYVFNNSVSSSMDLPLNKLGKVGQTFQNNGLFSADYTITINGMQSTLPVDSKITDVLGTGMRVNIDTVKLYEAKISSLEQYETVKSSDPIFSTLGKVVKADEVDSSLYSFETKVLDDGRNTLVVNLPSEESNKMYVLEYSADIYDKTQSSYSNQVQVNDETLTKTESTFTKAVLLASSGGGKLSGVKKTNVSVIKTDSQTGAKIQGAKFGLYRGDKLIEELNSDENGSLKFELLDVGKEYTIKEITPATGYYENIGTSKTFIATEEEQTFEFENTKREGNIRLNKVDSDIQPLSDTVFGIWSNYEDVSKTNPEATATSDENGYVLFENLEANNTYYIREITAKSGYAKVDHIYCAVMDENNINTKLYIYGQEDTPIDHIINHKQIYSGLTISKEVVGGGDTNQEFNFTISLDEQTINGVCGDVEFKDGVANFKLKDDQTITISNLPIDVDFEITEEQVANYTMTTTLSSGTITEEVQDIIITNTYKAPPVITENPPINQNQIIATKEQVTTGDDSQINIWVAMLGLSIVTLGFILYMKKREHE